MKRFRRLANSKGFSPAEDAFVEGIFRRITEGNDIIDKIIETTISSGESINEMGLLDRNILRLGVCELLYGDNFDVPPRVALDEAIEITKSFLNDNARKFVSGVLGGVYVQLRDTDEEGNFDKDPEKKYIRNQKQVGAVIYRVTDKQTLEFAFVQDAFNKWTLSKGNLLREEEDDVGKGLGRVIREEVGVDITIIDEVGLNTYMAHTPDEPVRKKVRYFLVKTEQADLVLEEKEGLKDARWFTPKEMETLSTYSDLKDIMWKSVEKAKEEENIA